MPDQPTTIIREKQLRLVCGEDMVIVYPRRISAQFAATIRARLGKGPGAVMVQFDRDTAWELDNLAELLLIGLEQAGMPTTLEQAQQHPIITRWDELGGMALLELVPDEPDLAVAVAAAGAEVAPDPLP